MCRVSGNVHLCTPAQCRWQRADRVAGFVDPGKKRPVRAAGATVDGESRPTCWATGRPADELCNEEEGEFALDSTDRLSLSRHMTTAAGVEKVLITFKDKRMRHALTTVTTANNISLPYVLTSSA